MATNTYVALDKVTVATATPSVTFSSISQEYTDLVLVCSGADNVGIYARLGNGSIDSGTNYSYTYLLGDGSNAASGRNSNVTKGYLSLSSDVSAKQFHTITNFQNYSNTNTYKTFLTRYSDATIYSAVVTNLWRNTAAVNIITVYGDGANIPAGFTFSLYGIKAWTDETTPKATGGYVYSDSTYWYHAFPSSSTFTPNQSITADILCVAGGGGTSSNFPGGGGAGGLLGFTSQSLTATGYTVTVGSGGAGTTDPTRGGNGTNSQFGGLTAAVGGGGSGARNGTAAGANGGSGGAAAFNSGTGGTGTAGQGNNGGGSASGSVNYGTGGGGGAGAAGTNGTSTTTGDGGVGSSAYSTWGLVTNTGHNVSGTVYYAGGGSGVGDSDAGAGGYGGGASAANGAGGGNGLFATGGGAAGSTKNGGSGIVIIRYPKA